jgi:hypothetical protein
MIKDAQGQAISGATADAVALYDRAVRAFNLGYGDPAGLFDAAREVSPGFTVSCSNHHDLHISCWYPARYHCDLWCLGR